MLDKLIPTNDLKMLSLNIASLNKYYTELMALLDSLTTKFDIIVLSEIRKSHSVICASLFDDYKHYYMLPNQGEFGGIMILVRNDLEVKELCNSHINLPGVESVFVEILWGTKRIVLGGIYKHPYVNIRDFDHKLTDCIENLPKNDITILAGDINIDMLKYENSPNIRTYFDNLIYRNILQVINGATRITKESQSIIDHIYIRTHQELNIKSGILTHPISDHLPTFLTINLCSNGSSKDKPFIRLINTKNINLFKVKMKMIIDKISSYMQQRSITLSCRI